MHDWPEGVTTLSPRTLPIRPTPEGDTILVRGRPPVPDLALAASTSGRGHETTAVGLAPGRSLVTPPLTRAVGDSRPIFNASGYFDTRGIEAADEENPEPDEESVDDDDDEEEEAEMDSDFDSDDLNEDMRHGSSDTDSETLSDKSDNVSVGNEDLDVISSQELEHSLRTLQTPR